MVAIVRPDSWNLPLFVHVAGAMLLVGALVVVTLAMAAALRRGDRVEVLTRLAFRTLLIGVIPAYVLMRAGAEWIASEENIPDELDWVGIGYIVADLGLLVFVIALVLAGIASWKRNSGVGKAAGFLGVLLLIAMVVAVWAMGAKPD